MAVFTYFLSWLVNALVISIITALVDDRMGYRIERKPVVAFLLVAVIPALLEMLAFVFEGKPFLAIIWPAFGMLL
jgi:nitrogen fixation/metabolism regulation signal transduction histidine kinase